MKSSLGNIIPANIQRIKYLFAILALQLASASALFAAPGELDLTFGTGGKVITPVSNNNVDVARGIALQPDGKIVVAGFSNNGSNYDFALARYNVNGSLDTSFDGDGKLTTGIGSGDDYAFSVGLQADGKIVVAGYSATGARNNFAVVRYLSNGSLDTSFDADGKAVIPVGNVNDEAFAVKIQADGKILIAGYSNTGSNFDFAVIRLNSDGSLDSTFGTGGKAVTPIGSGNDFAFAMALQADGKIVVGGVSNFNSNSDFALARYNSNGTLDSTFNGNGKVITPIGSADDFITSITFQFDGKILAAGYTTGATSDFALARYNPNGTLDSTFDNDGKVVTAVGNLNDEAYSVAVQSNGKILATGVSNNGLNGDFALVRYNVNGSPDITFDVDGKVTTPIGNGEDAIYSSAIQSDGKIVVAGSSNNGANDDFALARYTSDAPCTYQIPNSFEFPPGGGSATFTILTQPGCGWRISKEVDWITFSPNSPIEGSGTSEPITFNVATTVTGAARSSQLNISTSNGSLLFVGVFQSQCSYGGTAFFRKFPAEGGSGGFNITTGGGCPWSVFNSAPSWVIVQNPSGTGPSGVGYTVLPNFGPARSASIVAPGALTQTILQASGVCSYLLSATSANFQSTGGNGNLTVTTFGIGCPWTATTSDAWITINSGSGSGNGSISFSVQANTGPSRTGTINIAGQVFTINQSSGCTFTLSATNTSISATGGTGSFNITTNAGCTWAATTSDAWITINSGSGSGNGSISFSVQANTGTSRIGTINIAGQVFTINQSSGCTFTLPNTNTSISATGGIGSFNVTSGPGCAWTATSDSSWLTITAGGSGSGNGPVSFSVQPNTGIARTGIITAGGRTFTVNQLSGCTYSLSATSTNFGESGGTGSVSVTSVIGCIWTATSNASWINVTSGGSGTSNGTVNFTVSPNTGPTRTGTLTVAGQTFTVTQTTGCTYSLSSSGTQFPSSGGSGSFNITASAGCTWTATTSDAWITVNSGSGSGNGAVSFTVQANVGPPRVGTVNVNGQTYTINQASGCSYTLSVSSINLPETGGNGNFIINAGAGCIWSATANQNWITIISGNTGTGSGTVNFSVSPNNGLARTGAIAAAGQTFIINQSGQSARKPFDFDGDGKADLSLFRPSQRVWYVSKSSDSQVLTTQWGIATDKIVPADYNGDGKTDYAVFRDGFWYVLLNGGGFEGYQWGSAGDIPFPADFDGDGKADLAVFRNGTWFVRKSAGGTITQNWGSAGDIPVVADYDADNKADFAVFRTGIWFILKSTGGDTAVQWGIAGDKTVQADYNGDGKADYAVFRNGFWYILLNGGGFIGAQWGATGDLASPADYDGDGKTDLAVFRDGTWYIQRTTAGVQVVTFGSAGDKPVANAFVP